MSGRAPRVGKSFVSANLAHLLGEAGKRVVVVDADLRRGHLHRYFGQERAPASPRCCAATSPLQAALRATSLEGVQFLATGELPPNPAELLGSRAVPAGASRRSPSTSTWCSSTRRPSWR